MLTGTEALSRIDRTITQARTEATTLRQSLGALNERELAFRGDMRQALEELAAFRLDEAAREKFKRSASDLGPWVDGLMERREGEIVELRERADAIEARIAAEEEKREVAAARVTEVSEALDTAEAGLQAELEKDAGYQSQLEKSEAADTVAREAENKHATADADRKAKGEPYEADPLFMYLWKRKFGTSEYRHRGIIPHARPLGGRADRL